MAKIIKNIFGNFLVIFVIFSLIFSWFFSGWPRIWEKPAIPSEVKIAKAVTETFTASTTWTAPTGVTSVQVEVWGGGGAGGGNNSTADGGGGGGGGAYSKKNSVTVIPNNNYSVVVGAAGVGVANATGTAGADSWFISTSTVWAKGGGGGGMVIGGAAGAAGTGGAAASGVGDTKYSGGAGGIGRDNPNGIGGGGGGSGGTGSNGNAGATGAAGGAGATAVTGGGPGGNGFSGTGSGSAPASGPGGGGGGSGEGTNVSGGNGYVGQVKITYNTAPSFTAGPTDNPYDPVTQGNPVTFSATSTDSDSDNWYLAVCKTNSVTAGTPPTCATDQTYCVSSATSTSGSLNTCNWTSTGSGEQIWYAFACDDSSLQARCSSVASSTITVNVASVTCTTPLNGDVTYFGNINFNDVYVAWPLATTTVDCSACEDGFTMKIYGTGGGGNPGLYKEAAPADLIDSAAEALLEPGVEGYGIQATTTSPIITINPKFLKTGNNVGGLLVGSENAVVVASSTGPVTSQVVTIIFMAAVSAANELGNYQDLVTISCTVNEAPPPWACGDALVDSRDSKSYATVSIGSQCWMAESLNVGEMINTCTNRACVDAECGQACTTWDIAVNEQTDNLIIEKYCYNDLESNCDTYGGLYQWNEAMQYVTTPGVQGICPTGWHLPTDGEWTNLTNYLSADSQYWCDSNSAYIAKSLASQSGWTASANTCAVGNSTSTNNLTGLFVLPGGNRLTVGSFYSLSLYAILWSSTESGTFAWDRSLNYNLTDVYRDYDSKALGFSVRCLRE